MFTVKQSKASAPFCSSLITEAKHLPSTWAQGTLGTPGGGARGRGGAGPISTQRAEVAVRREGYNEHGDFASHRFQVRARISSFV